MASDADDLAALQTTRSNIIAQLAAITTDTPRYSVDGQTVESKRTYLLDQLDRVTQMMAALDSGFSVFSAADTP